MVYSLTTSEPVIASSRVRAGKPVGVDSAAKGRGGRLARAMQAVDNSEHDIDDPDVRTQAKDFKEQDVEPSEQDDYYRNHATGFSTEPDGAEAETHAKSSSRIVEVQDKQSSMKNMIAKIRENCEVLKGIEQQAESMASYLENAEADFGYLESKETTLANLYKASIDLATRYKDAKSTIAGQIKTISLLDNQNSENLVSLDNARLQVSRLESANETQSRENIELKENITRLEESNQSLVEKVEFSKKVEERIAGELVAVGNQLETTLSASEHKDTLLAEKSNLIDRLNSQIAQQSDELEIQRSKFSELQEKYLNNNEILQNITSELDSLRGEVDDRVLRVRNRCAEMETSLELTTQ